MVYAVEEADKCLPAAMLISDLLVTVGYKDVRSPARNGVSLCVPVVCPNSEFEEQFAHSVIYPPQFAALLSLSCGTSINFDWFGW